MKRIESIAFIVMLLLLPGTRVSAQLTSTVEAEEVIGAFRQYLETIPFLCEQRQEELNKEVAGHINCLKNWSDRNAYINEHQLNVFLSDQRDDVQDYQERMPALINSFLDQYSDVVITDSTKCREALYDLVNDRLGTLETNLNLLEREMKAEDKKGGTDMDWTLIGLIAGAVAIVAVIVLIVRSLRSNKTRPIVNNGNGYRSPSRPIGTTSGGNSGGDNSSGIVVRRKTATILKKQSLEDVIGNPNYLQVDTVDFCIESAVRRMYIKNTCIVELYNMYANDQTDPSQAREYGCMVLGRWVHDPESNEYYVSLEQIVLPGDDAVFEEYELNFGGKIKLKVLEMLRKLRRDTNLHYALTCWVHSHPGLTVFFSNADSSVQDQLKHPQHPNFLTAIVVDTLTPEMETGIFTYRRDGNLNSKNDLKLLYSLKDWYGWAQDSLAAAVSTPEQTPATPKEEQADINHEAYYNVLTTARRHAEACMGIELSKDVVADICQAVGTKSNGVAALLHGFASRVGHDTVYVAERLSSHEQEEKLQLVGCIVVAPHCSIPSVRKMVADRMDRLRFALVYTPSDGLLTTVPVIDGDLSADDAYFGEHKLDDLKQWTKNK